MRTSKRIDALERQLKDQTELITSLFRAITSHGITVKLPEQTVRRVRKAASAPNARRRWTVSDSNTAWSMSLRGVGNKEIARVLGRTEKSIDDHLRIRRNGK